ISIHALRGEGDPPYDVGDLWAEEFLSTPSVGRATYGNQHHFLPIRISIHALRGEGDADRRSPARNYKISIHALRGEVDSAQPPQLVKGSKFLSTPSVGRATMFPVSLRIMGLFLSTPSVGRATCYCWYWGFLTGFLSTPSVGRAT